MGFMDKAKKMAEQAQAKLDEVQKGVNTTHGGPPAGGGPVVEYDKHGRPIQPAVVTPDPAAPGGPPAPEDRNHPSTEAPKLSSGDPLAG